MDYHIERLTKILEQRFENGELIHQILKKYFEDKFGELWYLDDIIGQAKDLYNIDLTDEQAKEIAGLIMRTHDATIGINWEVITCAIEEFLPPEVRWDD